MSAVPSVSGRRWAWEACEFVVMVSLAITAVLDDTGGRWACFGLLVALIAIDRIEFAIGYPIGQLIWKRAEPSRDDTEVSHGS